MTTLILYASIEGQTLKIARFIENLARKKGHSVRMVDGAVKHATVDFEGVDRVILAASVHRRRHPPEFEKLISSQQDSLANLETLFLSVSLCAGFPEGIAEAQSYVEELGQRTGFVADKDLLVGGAIQHDKYQDYEAWIVSIIALGLNHHEEAQADQELTDWHAVKAAVTDFLRW